MANPVQENIFSQGYFYKPDGTRLGPQVAINKTTLLGQQNYRVSAGQARQKQAWQHYISFTNLKGLKGHEYELQKCKVFIKQVFKEMERYWFEQDNVSYQKEQNNCKMEKNFWKQFDPNCQKWKWAKKLRVQKVDNSNDFIEYTFVCHDPINVSKEVETQNQQEKNQQKVGKVENQ